MFYAQNSKVTRLTGEKPAEAINEKVVYSKPSTPYNRPVGMHKKWLPSTAVVHYLYLPSEFEGGGKKATSNLIFESVPH